MTAALYYDGATLRPRPVTIDADAATLRIRADEFERDVPLASLRATARLANVRRVIHLPDGTQLHCDDNDWVDRRFPRRGFEAVVDRLERNAGAVTASVGVIAVCAILFVTVGLPWFAKEAARAIPESALEALGNQTLRSLDATIFKPSGLEQYEQDRVRGEFAEFVQGLPDPDRYRVVFRDVPDVTNAFSLPGGTIVVTDAMVRSLPQPDALLAVLAHEVGHQAKRHVVRSVIEASAVGVVTALFASDVSSASAIVLGVPIFLLHKHYSRDFEQEADAFAFDTLTKRNISPDWFAYALAHIDRASLAEPREDVDDYTSSHPLTSARIEAARDRAKGFEPLVVLNAISIAETYGSGSDVAAAMQVGCWVGSKPRSDGSGGYRWYAQFDREGAFEIQFSNYDKDNKVVGQHSEGGTWAVRDGILSMRITRDGRVAPTDSLEAYRLERLGDVAEHYVSVPAGVEYDSERCDSVVGGRADQSS